ncbi:hypothetical protein [Algisphaera agarilytica]|uniref:Uncharacterized protein n=1 Tax=Algisphaera agarilytica TaxID=1385975 RepID=A0A7X0LKV2_9BACT|nr:hypothetical protein [Algisphaera agarilytica]MBB6430830.1 hypothetical protein [Algisphaera agarilytica]
MKIDLKWMLCFVAFASLAGCHTPERKTKTFDETVEDGKKEAVAAAVEALSADAEPFEPTRGIFDNDRPAWYRQGRLILHHNVKSNVYVIPDAKGNRLVSIVANHHKSVPRMVFEPKPNCLVWLEPIDEETQHITVTDLKANWHEAYIVTNEGVRPFGAEAYRDEIAELNASRAFFGSLREDLPK